MLQIGGESNETETEMKIENNEINEIQTEMKSNGSNQTEFNRIQMENDKIIRRGNWLFLGDYVDRGYFSIECFIFLLAIKINYPNRMHLLRGNHECRHLTKHFTFKLECEYKYGNASLNNSNLNNANSSINANNSNNAKNSNNSNINAKNEIDNMSNVGIYEKCMEAFDALPLAALVNDQLFCVHGGIGPDLKSPRDINSIDRFREPSKSGLFCDLLWSDPSEDYGEDTVDLGGTGNAFLENNSRGCSCRYTYKAVCSFLNRNHLLAVVRGHEAQDSGYRLYRSGVAGEFPSLITVFSAANYIDIYGNKGACIYYDFNSINIRQFNAAPHPYYLPKFMNVFDWSLPFVGEKVSELLLILLSIPDAQAGLAGPTPEELLSLESEKLKREAAIRSKIKAVGRFSRMLQTIRYERETLSEFLNVTGTLVVPAEYLIAGQEDIRKAIKSFQAARASDRINEMLPPTNEDSDTASISSLTKDRYDFGEEIEMEEENLNILEPNKMD